MTGRTTPHPAAAGPGIDPPDVALYPVILASEPLGDEGSIFGLVGTASAPPGVDPAALERVLRHPTVRVQLTTAATDGVAGVFTCSGVDELLVTLAPSHEPTARVLAHGTLAGVARLAAEHVIGEWRLEASTGAQPLLATWAVARLDGDRVLRAESIVLHAPSEPRPRLADEITEALCGLATPAGRQPAMAWPLAEVPAEVRTRLTAATLAVELHGSHLDACVLTGAAGTVVVEDERARYEPGGALTAVSALLHGREVRELRVVDQRTGAELTTWASAGALASRTNCRAAMRVVARSLAGHERSGASVAGAAAQQPS